MDKVAAYNVSENAEAVIIAFTGSWTIGCLEKVDHQIRTFEIEDGRSLTIDLSGLDQIDTAGAWVIYRFHRRISQNRPTEMIGLADEYATLLEVVAEHHEFYKEPPPGPHPIWALLERTGSGVARNWDDLTNSFGFFGLVLTVFWRGLRSPKRFRGTAFVHHLETAGFDGVTIVFTVSFLVGAVIAYMGGELLREFGAEILTIDLIAYSVLREFGVLLTAVMIAGRSGSAFTAQIGSMKAHEEIDAMRTLGLDPMELLVLPRVLALIVAMPILTFIADVAGLFGGALVSSFALDISPAMFVETLKEDIALRHFLSGLIKAPFFAILIGVIGCYQGLRVEGTAESIGDHTTIAVVQAIFAVIVVDASFAMFFQEIGF